jgi:hypothetical protein
LKFLLVSLPWVIGRNCAVIPYYFLKGKGKTIMNAKIDAIKGLHNMFKKRPDIVRKVSDNDIKKWIYFWCRLSRKKNIF